MKPAILRRDQVDRRSPRIGNSLPHIFLAIPSKFDDTCIEQLAAIAGLPTSVDRQRFGESVRQAACA
jgi:hypothetical protein